MKQSPVQLVYDDIRNKIIRRQMFPGNRIIEEDLAQELGTSRTSIRSALQQLRQDGFVEIIPNRGSFVVQPTLEDIIALYDVRLTLESGAIKAAVENATDDTIRYLEHNLRQQLELDKNFSISAYSALNRDFHWQIAKASLNPYYERFLAEVYNKVEVYMLFYDKSIDNSYSYSSHKEMLTAICERDLNRAEAAVIADNEKALADIRYSFSSL
ncbi:MAG: GntR family transcriptional regulator [Firmicutes bacterium]|nr:GntR family transcriptional regulator [Bacillota bacterium]